MSKIEKPAAGATSVRMGPAFLRAAREKDHFELMRPIITVKNEGDRLVTEQHSSPIGPIAVYRVKRRGDKVNPAEYSITGPAQEIKTSDPKTGQPMELILVWWPGKDGA